MGFKGDIQLTCFTCEVKADWDSEDTTLRPGDILVVDPNGEPKSGELVYWRAGKEYRVGRCSKKDNGNIEIDPLDPRFEKVTIPKSLIDDSIKYGCAMAFFPIVAKVRKGQ